MLDTLPSLPSSRASAFIQTVTTLASSPSTAHLFAPHLPALLNYLPSLMLPQCNDPGPTPTVGRPFPASEASSNNGVSNGGPSTPTQGTGRSAFVFPPIPKGSPSGDDLELEYEQETRKAALELLVGLTEARPGMVKRVEGWVALGVRACLEGMGEIGEDEEGGGGHGRGLRKLDQQERDLVTWSTADVSVCYRLRSFA